MKTIKAIFDNTKPQSIVVKCANAQEYTLSGNFEMDVEDGAIINEASQVDDYKQSINNYVVSYISKTAEEKKQERIEYLKGMLSSSDYIYAKCTETGEDVNVVYADVIVNRKAWRKEIQELEG